MKFNNFKVNCSSLGSLITNAKGNTEPTEKQWSDFFSYINKDTDKITPDQQLTVRDIVMRKMGHEPNKLSGTMEDALCKIFSYEIYGKSSLSGGGLKPLTLDKGVLGENEAIKMLSRVDGVEYSKNEEMFTNRYLKGIPDIVIKKGAAVKLVKDIKVVYDLPSFIELLHTSCDKDNSWQMTGFLDILKLKEGEICHCLVNMPEEMILAEINRITEKYKMLGYSDEQVDKKISELRHSMVYDEIPEHLRIYRYKVKSNGLRVSEIKKKMSLVRKWMRKTYDYFQNTLPLTA